MNIAASEGAFSDALFQSGGTYDGYIDRKLANGIRLFYLGETYFLNRENVFCLATKQPDGKTWFSYGGKLNRATLTARYDLAQWIRRSVN